MKKMFIGFAIFALVVSLGGAPAAASAATVIPLSQVQSGDLIRGTTYSSVYYMGRDGFRYVFPNDKTYFTWYPDFSTVKWISDADLGKVQIGGNVTYKPGVKMLKINSDPKTYAVDNGGTLRWVTSEEVAVGLYGADWNTKIDDVPDAFFGNYKKGSDLTSATMFAPSLIALYADSINSDKGLFTAITVSITDDLTGNYEVIASTRDAIRFQNDGAMAHNLLASDESWGTGTLQPGDSFSKYFKTPGVYTWTDVSKPSLTGTITIE